MAAPPKALSLFEPGPGEDYPGHNGWFGVLTEAAGGLRIASSVGGAVTRLPACFGVESWYALAGTPHPKLQLVTPMPTTPACVRAGRCTPSSPQAPGTPGGGGSADVRLAPSPNPRQPPLGQGHRVVPGVDGVDPAARSQHCAATTTA